MTSETKVIGQRLEQAEETRRLHGASDGEPAVVVEIPTHPVAATQTRVVISRSDVSGSWLIWGVGSWNYYNWSATTGSPETLQVVNYNDTWTEKFQVDRFNIAGSTTAEWNNNGSLVFPSGTEVMETERIFAEPDRYVTEVAISSESFLGSYTYEIMTNQSGSWMTIPENELTILEGPGSVLRLKVGSPVGTGLRFWYQLDNDTVDSTENLNAIGSRISPVPLLWWGFNDLDSDLGSGMPDMLETGMSGSAYNVVKEQQGKTSRCYKYDGPVTHWGSFAFNIPVYRTRIHRKCL